MPKEQAPRKNNLISQVQSHADSLLRTDVLVPALNVSVGLVVARAAVADLEHRMAIATKMHWSPEVDAIVADSYIKTFDTLTKTGMSGTNEPFMEKAIHRSYVDYLVKREKWGDAFGLVSEPSAFSREDVRAEMAGYVCGKVDTAVYGNSDCKFESEAEVGVRELTLKFGDVFEFQLSRLSAMIDGQKNKMDLVRLSVIRNEIRDVSARFKSKYEGDRRMGAKLFWFDSFLTDIGDLEREIEFGAAKSILEKEGVILKTPEVEERLDFRLNLIEELVSGVTTDPDEVQRKIHDFLVDLNDNTSDGVDEDDRLYGTISWKRDNNQDEEKKLKNMGSDDLSVRLDYLVRLGVVVAEYSSKNNIDIWTQFVEGEEGVYGEFDDKMTIMGILRSGGMAVESAAQREYCRLIEIAGMAGDLDRAQYYVKKGTERGFEEETLLLSLAPWFYEVFTLEKTQDYIVGSGADTRFSSAYKLALATLKNAERLSAMDIKDSFDWLFGEVFGQQLDMDKVEEGLGLDDLWMSALEDDEEEEEGGQDLDMEDNIARESALEEVKTDYLMDVIDLCFTLDREDLVSGILDFKDLSELVKAKLVVYVFHKLKK